MQTKKTETKTDTTPETSCEIIAQRMIALSSIDAAPTNPRTGRGSKESWGDLLKSIKQFGVLTPILVRPKGDRFEVVFGSRRFAAAKECGLTEIPATVRDLSDRDVLEAQLVENCQRADMSAIDEGEAYKRLHAEFGLDADEIAAKIGRSRSHVYGRMKLGDLSKKAAKACRDGTITESVALLIARLPLEEQQDRFVETCVKDFEFRGEPMSARAAAELIHRTFHLALLTAPFDCHDATLVPSAGACENCPKRTGNQRLLFKDIEDDNTCTDATCFDSKVAANWERVTAEATAKNVRVLPNSAAKTVFAYGDSVGRGWVDLDAQCPHDDRGRTWRRAIGKGVEEARAIVKNSQGAAVSVIEYDKAFEIAKQNGAAWVKKSNAKPPAEFDKAKHDEAQRKQREKEARQDAIDAVAIEQAAQNAAAKIGDGPSVIEHVLRLVCLLDSYSFEQAICDLLEAQGVAKAADHADVAKHVKKLACGGLAALVVGAGLRSMAKSYGPEGVVRKQFADALDVFGVDLARVAKEYKAPEVETPATVEADAKQTDAAKKTTKKKSKKTKAGAA